MYCAGNNRYYDDEGPRRFVPGPFCKYDYQDLTMSVKQMQYSLHSTPVSTSTTTTSSSSSSSSSCCCCCRQKCL